VLVINYVILLVSDITFEEYVQIKPILALVTLILKFTDKYKEGDLRSDAGYLYVSLIYNISICVA
jgi:hypothetical protein